MAVYEHTYKPYAGRLTPAWARFLVIPRHAYQSVFRSKLFTAFFAFCFACPLVMMILIYLHHNTTALAIFGVQEVNSDLIPINSYFFRTFVSVQGSFGFLLTVLIGPALVSRDLTNNALPLYLCRPFSRAEYVAGKMSVLLILLSTITWVPGLLLFFFQSYLEGAGWFAANAWMAWAIIMSSWTWIIILSLLSMALSAWIKWRMAASGALFALFIIPNAIGFMVNGLFLMPWGHLTNPLMLIQTVNDNLFRQPNTFDLPPWMVLPVWSAWGAIIAFCAFCVFLISRKVRAYEVVG